MKNKIAALALATTLVLPGLTPVFAADAAEDIKVEKATKYYPAGTYKRADLLKTREALEKAVSANNVAVGSAEFLIENVPNSIKPVRAKLDKQLAESKKLIAEANAMIADIDALLK